MSFSIRRAPSFSPARLSLLGAAALLALSAAPAIAQVRVDPAAEAGHHAPMREERLPTLTLDAAARSEVPQDTVQVTMAYETEAADAAAVSAALNKVLKATLDDARGKTGVTARNGGYQVYPSTDDKGKISAWRGRAEVVLESRDFEATSALTGTLGQRMAVTGISFSLSDQARQAEEAKLLVSAAAAFNERAKNAVQAFGFAGYTVSNLTLSGSGVISQPRPMMMRAASMKSAPVALEGGQAEVTVSVTGVVKLLAK
jgi:predicted secreted protein